MTSQIGSSNAVRYSGQRRASSSSGQGPSAPARRSVDRESDVFSAHEGLFARPHGVLTSPADIFAPAQGLAPQRRDRGTGGFARRGSSRFRGQETPLARKTGAWRSACNAANMAFFGASHAQTALANAKSSLAAAENNLNRLKEEQVLGFIGPEPPPGISGMMTSQLALAKGVCDTGAKRVSACEKALASAQAKLTRALAEKQHAGAELAKAQEEDRQRRYVGTFLS